MDGVERHTLSKQKKSKNFEYVLNNYIIDKMKFY